MPPRMALSRHAVHAVRTEQYVCPSCLFTRSAKQLSTSSRVIAPTTSSRRRSLSTATLQPGRLFKTNTSSSTAHRRLYASDGSLASSTAINAPSTVPPALREVHQQLLLLQDKASSYVDLSRLQLALRSLESEDPLIRVAVLGLGANGMRAARKLVRVLLSDALGEEEAWERELLDGEESLLVRYGQYTGNSGVQSSSAGVVKSMGVPSEMLRKLNLEIMIAPLLLPSPGSLGSKGTLELEDSILVPPVTIPNSVGGRVSFVRYPIHKAMVVAEGISGAVEYGRLPSAATDSNIINAALSLPLRPSSGSTSPEEEVFGNAVDIDLAAHALNLFRTNIADGVRFNEEWQTSRVPAISDWLAAAADVNAPNGLKPAADALLQSILARADSSISAAEVASTAASTGLTIPDLKRTALQASLATWSEEAHRDLQVNFPTMLTLPTWLRTTWWRLFWRIDEVSISASDVLRRGWLVEAEQNLAFLSGRVLEAGVTTEAALKAGPLPAIDSTVLAPPQVDEVSNKEESIFQSKDPDAASLTIAELGRMPPLLTASDSSRSPTFNPLWPQTIHLARQQMLRQLVPSLHRKGQALLLGALSTIGGTSALAAWLVVASGFTAAYEAGAIGALGLVWTLRRLQTKWGKERDAFAETAREDGRRVLVDVEDHLASLVRDGGRVDVRESDRTEWAGAREGISAVRQALEATGAAKDESLAEAKE